MAAVVLAMLAIGTWWSWTYFWLPPGTSTVSRFYASDSFRQCSRSTPPSDGTFWIPTSAQIREVEAALPPMLAQRARQGLKMPRKSETFVRQYVGFAYRGEPLIYVNAHPAGFLDEDEDRMSLLDRVEKYLPEQPASVCDGGTYLWGVVYIPRTKTFTMMEFNGQ